MNTSESPAAQLAGVHKRLEAARARLLEAVRERRAIERLRERRYEAWLDNLTRRETAELNEIGAVVAARRSRSLIG